MFLVLVKIWFSIHANKDKSKNTPGMVAPISGFFESSYMSGGCLVLILYLFVNYYLLVLQLRLVHLF